MGGMARVNVAPFAERDEPGGKICSACTDAIFHKNLPRIPYRTVHKPHLRLASTDGQQMASCGENGLGLVALHVQGIMQASPKSLPAEATGNSDEHQHNQQQQAHQQQHLQRQHLHCTSKQTMYTAALSLPWIQAPTAQGQPQTQLESSPAIFMAACAILRRLRIQQRSQCRPQRHVALLRPASPPPLTLTGAQLLSGCQPGSTACTALRADLSSRQISSVATSCSAHSWAEPPFTSFSQLSFLDLSDNRLTCFAGLAEMPALHTLCLTANRLSSLMGLEHLWATPECAQTGQCNYCVAELQLQQPGQHQHQEQEQEQQQEQQLQAWELQLQQLQPDIDIVGPHLAAPRSTCPASAAYFTSLSVLDVSYNSIPAVELLGEHSHLANLPRLAELLAEGSGMKVLPAVLGRFLHLSRLELGFNQLGGDVLLSLAQLPALCSLGLASNPVQTLPALPPEVNGTTLLVCSALRQLNLSGTCITRPQDLAPLHGHAPGLAQLMLGGTPLARTAAAATADPSCRALAGATWPGLQIDLHALPWSSGGPKSMGTRHKRSACQPCQPPPLVLIDEVGPTQRALAAAGAGAEHVAQHAALSAMLDRAHNTIDTWQARPSSLQPPDSCPTQSAGDRQSDDGDDIQDRTFLTGVGIMGQLQLPGSNGAPSPGVQADSLAGSEQPLPLPQQQLLQDPTERLAVALGLRVSQLAHHTHRAPRDTLGALHRLQHALAHPFAVAASTATASTTAAPQHRYTTATIATAGKARSRPLAPLPQPIPLGLETRVVVEKKLEDVIQHMHARLAAVKGALMSEIEGSGNCHMTGGAS